MVWEDSNVYLKQGILNLSQRVNLRRESVYFVSTQFRASPFERALFSALNRVLLIN